MLLIPNADLLVSKYNHSSRSCSHVIFVVIVTVTVTATVTVVATVIAM